MTDENRNDFDQALDILARILRVTPLDSEAKFGYFKVLKRHSMSAFIDSMNKVAETYKPRRKDDFPVPAAIIDVIAGVVESSKAEDHEVARTYAEVQAEFRARGMLIGDEAREALERDWHQRMRAQEYQSSLEDSPQEEEIVT